MKSAPARLQAKHDFWEEHFRQWKVSGLSQAGYCRTKNISLRCFVFWKRKRIGAKVQRPWSMSKVEGRPGLFSTEASLFEDWQQIQH